MMKTSFKSLLCIGCIACAFTACSDDDNDNNIIDPNEGAIERVKDATVQFRISQNMPGSYAASPANIDPATDEESKITGKVKIYVFDDQGFYEDKAELDVILDEAASSSNGHKYIYDSDPATPMAISSGNKYFYVFANMSGIVSDPATGENRKAFEKRTLNSDIADMTKDDNFFIATLEPAATTVQSVTTTQTITLQVGRLAAKVLLKDEEPTIVRGFLEGEFDFDNATFRLINLPLDYYLIGQSNPGITTPGNYMDSPHFTATYADLTNSANKWITPPTNPWSNGLAPGTSVYAKENTHENPMNGSATSVQYRVQYQPAKTEIYGTNGELDASFSGGTFWMASVGLQKDKYLFSAAPSGTIPNLGDVDASTVVKYEDGYSYYVIPITDQSETVAKSKYSVVRNHSYILTLNTIARLGSGNPDVVDPEIPIDELYDIVFKIEVLPWYKIEQEVNL